MKKIPFIACKPVALPDNLHIKAAKEAIKINPANRPALEAFAIGSTNIPLEPMQIAVLTSKYWGSGGVKLGVTFLDSPDSTTKRMILEHMNAWNKWANVVFGESRSGQVRIARTPGSGYWSYLGTDVLQIRAGQPTMNLDSFTSRTPLSEYKRVVRHETGHTLGCPHEHSRSAIIALLDRAKTIRVFQQLYGWPPTMTIQQVLTPISEQSVMGTTTDRTSIMCYQFDGSCTKNGLPIPGGLDINSIDGAFMGKIYPKVK